MVYILCVTCPAPHILSYVLYPFKVCERSYSHAHKSAICCWFPSLHVLGAVQAGSPRNSYHSGEHSSDSVYYGTAHLLEHCHGYTNRASTSHTTTYTVLQTPTAGTKIHFKNSWWLGLGNLSYPYSCVQDLTHWVSLNLDVHLFFNHTSLGFGCSVEKSTYISVIWYILADATILRHQEQIQYLLFYEAGSIE